MSRKIRITSETYDFDHRPTVEYMELPDGWDTWTKVQRDEYLNDAAMAAVALRAGGGACVVDENDKEIEEA